MTEQDPYLNEQYVREILGNNVTVRGMTTQYTAADEIEQYIVEAQNIAACDIFIDSDLYNELPQEVYDEYNNAGRRTGGSSIIGVTTMTVNYRDKKDYSGIYKFIDAVKEDGKTIIVTEFNKDEDQQATTEAEGSVNLKIYSIYPLNIDKVMEESDQFVFDPSLVETEETEAAE